MLRCYKLIRLLIAAGILIQLGVAQSGGRVSGYLRAGDSGEPLIYANIILAGTAQGAATDVHGYYVIPDIPPGRFNLKAMMMGYQTGEREITVTANSDQRIDLELQLQAIEGEEVTVTADRVRFEEKVEVSRINLSTRDIKAAPALVEADLFRSLQLMPGVQSHNDFTSALVVRGGSPDENLILLDGIEVYNPYHLGGVFSTFNAEALSDAEFLAGGFPSKFGNRNSSVLSITSKEGDSKNHRLFKNRKIGEYWDLSQLQGEISLLSSKFLAEGPVKNGSWMWAWRRSYYDTLARLYYNLKGEGEPLGAYYLWDTQGKLIYNISPTDRLTLSAYYGRDVFYFNFDDDDQGFVLDMDWGNYTTSLQWRKVPSSKFVNLLSLAKTNYDWDLNLAFSQIDSVYGKTTTKITEDIILRDWTLKEQLDWYLAEQHTISGGFEFKILDMQIAQNVGDFELLDRKQSPYILSLFLQDKWQPRPLLSIQGGIRFTNYEIHKRIYAEPRIGFKYLLTENIALKGSWGIYKQFIFTNTSDEEIINFVDLWIPVPDSHDAQSAQHFICGVEQWLGEGFFASFEAYYKPYDNVLDINPRNDPVNPEDDFIAGTGMAWGLEFLVKKTSGRLSGWIGYTYSRLEKSIDFNSSGKIDENLGEVFNPKYDRPHNFNGVLSFQLNEKNSFGLVVSSNSGQPYTPVIGKTYSQANFGSYSNPYDELQNLYGLKNSKRYPAYFRVDISWGRNIKLLGIKGKFKLQVLNVTNNFNTLFYQWDHEKSPSEVTAFSMFPTLPTFGVEFKL